MNDIFTISDVAKKTGLSQDTIRYYEKIKLLPPAKRNEHNKRQYIQMDIDRILFINHLKRTQMPLKQIREYENSHKLKMMKLAKQYLKSIKSKSQLKLMIYKLL